MLNVKTSVSLFICRSSAVHPEFMESLEKFNACLKE